MTDTQPPPQGDSEQFSDLNTQQAPSNTSSYRPLVHAPRPVGFEIVLGLITLNTYFCFWAVARAKDLKRMRSNNFEPWLWFFAPLLGIVQLFAFARMFSELKVIEGQRLHHQWHRLGWLWILLLFVSGMIGSATTFELLPGWLFYATIAFDTALLALVHHRFNSLKRHDKTLLHFHGRSSWFYWWEWALMGVAALAWSAFAYFAWDRHQSIIEELPAGYTYQSVESNFQISISGPGWLNVELGTYASDDAEVEFGNAADTASIIVFKHALDSTLNSVATYRYKARQSSFDSIPECSEKRELSQDQKSIASTAICLSESALEGAFSISKLIVIEDRIYEFLGWVEAPARSYKKEKAVLLAAADSFSVINIAGDLEE